MPGISNRNAVVRLTDRARCLSGAFAASRTGTIAIIFSFSFPVLLMAAGGAVDYASWQKARQETINAMDTAVLAGGRVLQIPGNTEADAIAAAQDYYARNKSNGLSVDSVTFTVEDNGTRVVARSHSAVASPFLSVIGISALAINETVKAEIASGKYAGSNLEVSMMLDVTASMTGTKIDDLKMAAKDLVDILIWDDQSTYTSRVALVPFADSVNVGSYFNAVTNATPTAGPCVKERLSTTDRYTDNNPMSSPMGYIGDGQADIFGNEACRPASSPIAALTSSRAALKTQIEGLTADGNTAGHLGVAWAWYTISSKWSPVWPSASKPDPESHLSIMQSNGKPKLRKVAVLMTDGEFNTYYRGEPSATQAPALCSSMKAEGIIIYSVAFDVAEGSYAEATMKDCATDASHYYRATDGDGLKMAFRSIGLKISTLRLAE